MKDSVNPLDVKDKNDPEKPQKGQTKPPTDSLFQRVKANPVRTARKLISITESAMQSRQATWQRYRRKYRRGLYYLTGLNTGVPLFFTNYIFANVESTKSHLTRNMPTLMASPRGLRDDFAADLMTRALQDTLMRGGIKRCNRGVVHHGLVSTMGYYKVYFSEEKDNVVIESLAPESVGVDPKAIIPEHGRWAYQKRSDVPSDEIYAEYGVIPQRYDDEDAARQEDALSRDDSTYVSEDDLRPATSLSSTFDVYEFWIRCWEEDRENDWYILTIAGGTVLREEFSIYDHNQCPFVVWFAMEDFSGDNIYFRGVGAIEEIEPLQDRADALDLKIYKGISLLTNRQRFVSTQAGLNHTSIDNTAGRTYMVNGDPQKAVHYDSPPQMPLEVYNYRDRTEMLIQTVSGIFDVTQGRRPTGITAGRAIESLKDSAETRLAALVDTLSEALEKVGNLTLQTMLQMYDGERLIKSVDGDKTKDFIMVADYPDELQPQSIIDPVTEELIEGEMTPEIDQMRQEWKKTNNIALVLSDVTYDWDIKADADNALPSARAERSQVAADLFRLGAIDREALLETMNFPGRHHILQRLASEITGKDAGDSNAEAGIGMAQQMMEQFEQLLLQIGIPQDQAQQLLEAMVQQSQGGGTPQGDGTPAQMTM